MKKLKLIIIFTILFGALLPGIAQNITFGGSSINIAGNTEMHIMGNVSFIAESAFHNDGEVLVGGDWENLTTSDLEMQDGSGSIVFNGANPQIIGGNERTFFANLDIRQDVALEIETRIYSDLKLDQSKLTLNNYNLFIMPGGEISGANDQGYIDASSEGFLIRQVADQEVIFPVGNVSEYLPAILQNLGVTDNYGLQVFDDILSNGISGPSIPEIDDCVVNTWYFIEEVPGGSVLDLNLQWDEPVEGTAFNRSLSAVGHYSGGTWVPADPTNASGSGPWQQSLSGITESGAFAIGDSESPMAITIQYDEQEITIAEGWSGISSFLNPLNPEFDNIFAEVMNEIIIVRDLFDVYWPSQGINTLGTWDTHSGYQVKMSGEVTINLAGTPLVNATLNLDAGWNIFPILIDCRSNPVDLFSGTSAVIVREVAGTGIYWPEFNINTLGLLLPGSAYMVYMQSAEDVEFPACKKSSGLDYSSGVVDEAIWNPVAEKEIARTNIQHTVAITANALTEAGFETGDFLMAVSGEGSCYGSLEYEGGNVPMTIFGDDMTTIEKDGFSEGEQVLFKHWNASAGETELLEPIYDFSYASHNGHFANNGISAISAFKASDVAESYQKDITIYPNPAVETIRIQGDFENAEIRIMDLQGSQRMMEINYNRHNEIDVSALPSGVYLFEIRTEGADQVWRKRLVIK